MMNENSDEQLNSFLSDSSFVILGQGSLQSADSSNITQNGFSLKSDKNGPSSNIPDQDVNKNCTISFASSTQDIQSKLDQLLKENFQLKETLNQNNLAMKTQFETLVMWQQEVFKTHQSHKEKFAETRDLVLKLRAENGILKKQMEEGLSKSQLSIKDSDLERENLSLKVKLNEMEEKLSHTRVEEIVKDKIFLEAKSKTLEEEYFEVKKELAVTLELNDNLKKEIEELKSQKERFESLPSLLPNSEARVQISNLFKQLEEERLKVSKLKEELKNVKADNKESASSMLSDCINRLDDMSLSYNKQNERFTSMNSWLCLAEESMVYKPEETENRLKSEIAFLKKHLIQEQASSMEKRESLAHMQVQFEKLLKDYEELQKQYRQFEEEAGKLKKLEEEIKRLKKFEEEVGNLNVVVKEKDRLAEQKLKEFDSVLERQRKLELECEEVGILRAQVETYQIDFNAEREAREKLVGEKEEMAEQVRLLQRRVKELEEKNPGRASAPPTEEASAQPNTSQASKPIQRSEEVKKQFTPPEPKKPEVSNEAPPQAKKPPPPTTESNPPPKTPRGDNRPKCPLCMYRSADMEDLERHANFCLDTYMLP